MHYLSFNGSVGHRIKIIKIIESIIRDGKAKVNGRKKTPSRGNDVEREGKR